MGCALPAKGTRRALLLPKSQDRVRCRGGQLSDEGALGCRDPGSGGPVCRALLCISYVLWGQRVEGGLGPPFPCVRAGGTGSRRLGGALAPVTQTEVSPLSPSQLQQLDGQEDTKDAGTLQTEMLESSSPNEDGPGPPLALVIRAGEAPGAGAQGFPVAAADPPTRQLLRRESELRRSRGPCWALAWLCKSRTPSPRLQASLWLRHGEGFS